MVSRAPKEFDPDDPMELVGVSVPGADHDQILDGLVLEYLMMGWKPVQIRFLFRSPQYGVCHQVYRQKGEAYVKKRIEELAARWAEGWLTGDDAGARDGGGQRA